MGKLVKAKKGITLVEVVISVAIIAILLIPIGSLVMKSVNGNKRNENKQEATTFAQELLDEFSNVTTSDYRKINNNKGDLTLPNGEIITLDNWKGNKTISKKDGNTTYSIEYEVKKSDKVTQDKSVDDTRKDVEKYGTVIKINRDNLQYGSNVVGGDFQYSSIPLSNFGKKIYVHLSQVGGAGPDKSNINEIIIESVDASNNMYSKKINLSLINGIDKNQKKVIQEENYKEYSKNQGEHTIYFSSDVDVGKNDNGANVDFIVNNKAKDDKDYLADYNIITKLEAKFNGTLYETPKLTPKYIYGGVEKTTPIGDLYEFTVTVKEGGNEIFKGTSSSNIYLNIT